MDKLLEIIDILVCFQYDTGGIFFCCGMFFIPGFPFVNGGYSIFHETFSLLSFSVSSPLLRPG